MPACLFYDKIGKPVCHSVSLASFVLKKTSYLYMLVLNNYNHDEIFSRIIYITLLLNK